MSMSFLVDAGPWQRPPLYATVCLLMINNVDRFLNDPNMTRDLVQIPATVSRHILASHWSAPGHVTPVLASDWSRRVSRKQERLRL